MGRTSWERPAQTLLLCGRQLTQGQGHLQGYSRGVHLWCFLILPLIPLQILLLFDITVHPLQTWSGVVSSGQQMGARAPSAASPSTPANRSTAAAAAAWASAEEPGSSRGSGAGPLLLLLLLESRQRTAKGPTHSHGPRRLKPLQLDLLSVPQKLWMPFWSHCVALQLHPAAFKDVVLLVARSFHLILLKNLFRHHVSLLKMFPL